MNAQKNDYLVATATEDGKRWFLMKVLEADKKEVTGVVEKGCHIKRNVVTVPAKQVVINIGPRPHFGKVYGVDVTNLYQGRKIHDDFGAVNFFYRPEKKVGADLWAAFDKSNKILKKHGLEFLQDDLIWEILPYHGGKYAGMYIKTKGDTVLPRIQIRPETMPSSEFVYVIMHELGHHLHFKYLTSKKLNATWVKAFNTSIKVSTVKKEVSQMLLDSLLDQEDVPSAFKGQLGEEEALAYKWVLRTIQSSHNISIKELDLLFEAQMKDEIRSLWPVRTIPRKELAPIISEYATKNYRETLAEAFAFHMTGRKLPEAITRLLEKSIAYAKANREK